MVYVFSQEPKPKPTLAKTVWSWPVVGGALFFIFGGGLTFTTSGHPTLADAFYAFGAALFLAKFLIWNDLSTTSNCFSSFPS